MDTILNLLLSFASATCVAGTNTLIGIVIRKFAHKEERNT